MESAELLRAGVTRIQTFVERFAAGVQPRLGTDVAVDPPESGPTSAAALGEEAAGGALAARVIWSEGGTDHAACLLWGGDLAPLLGEGGERPAAELTDEEVATLDGSLRLAVEEGAEAEMPFEWSALERVAPADLATVLRDIGASDATDRVRVAVRLGDAVQTFLLVPVREEEAGEPTAKLAAEELVDPVGDLAPAAGTAVDEGAPAATPGAGAAAPELRNLGHLLDVRLPLTIRLGSTRLPLDDVLRLAPGAIVELDRGEDEPLEVLANGRVIARGEVVVVDERFGLRITEIGSPEERLRASV